MPRLAFRNVTALAQEALINSGYNNFEFNINLFSQETTSTILTFNDSLKVAKVSRDGEHPLSYGSKDNNARYYYLYNDVVYYMDVRSNVFDIADESKQEEWKTRFQNIDFFCNLPPF